MKNITLKPLLVILLLTGLTVSAQVVTSSSDNGADGTLRTEVAQAAPGSIITFAPGISDITLTSGFITIDKSITITGNGILNTTVNGNNASRIFDITTGNVVLNDFEIENGLADNGGGIRVFNATLTINALRISSCTANGASGSGGGIYLGTNSELIALNSTISTNTANRAGGGIESVAGTNVTLTNVQLIANNAGVTPATASPGNGGGFHITGSGTATITGGLITMNMSAAEGGGLWNGSGTMSINGTTISDNTTAGAAADNGGGGIYNLNGGTLTIQNAIISGNSATGTAGSGGGIFNDVGGMLTVSNSSIIQNTANRAGGGIEDNSGAGSAVVLTNVLLNENEVFTSPGNGGGLHVTGQGDVTISGGTVNMNEAGAEGGGLWNGTGVMTIDGTTIDGNTASGALADQGGGGIYNLNGGTLTITNAVISDNIANGTAGSGGGILNDVGSQLSISNSTISGNSARRAGGGIEDNSATSTLTLTNVNLSNNTVTGAPGNGGAIHITGAGSINISGGTVSNNTAALEGGGLWNGTGTMNVSGTTISGNVAQGAAADDGGAGIFNNGGTLNLNNAILTSNLATGTSGSGGGLLSTAGTVTIIGTVFDNNSANRAGGAIEIINGTLMLSDSDMLNNDVDGGAGTANPGNGGALHISGITTTTINGGTVSGNTAMREGGGLWNQTGSTMNLVNVTIDSNSAEGTDILHGGGGIFNNGGTLNLTTSTVSNNSTTGTNSNGGGLHVKAGTANIMLSTISGNTTANNGGGIYNNAITTVNATTITDNTATSSGGGVANNSANSIALKNTIVAGNFGVNGADVFSSNGTLLSNGYNLIGVDGTNAFPANANDIEGSNPLLGPLADNGGQTMTHMLLTSSPAYNAGDPLDQFNDQTGSPVFGGIRDIGSYEAQSQLGVNQYATGSRIVIYPNPSNGTFTISLRPDFGNDVTGKVYELASGKTIAEFAANEPTTVIDLNNFASGVYIVQVVSDITTETHKVLISKN
ncbi:MAG TPA: choice-of-anchor Q domain-containing protein [Flavobacterium sp.]|jgi:hypothetical protein